MASNYKPSVGVQGGLYPLGQFPIAKVSDIEYPIIDKEADVSLTDDGYFILEPDTFYVFGTVDSLRVYCNEPEDGRLHEFAFEFTPSAQFAEIEFGGEAPSWANTLQFTPGKTCQVSIVRGIGVGISVV